MWFCPQSTSRRPRSCGLLGISRQSFYDILDEKQPVTPAMALRFGKLFGNGPDIWLNMQRQYDIAKAQKAIGAEVKSIPTLKVA
jgi:plasmid maintenance system antidote protein VapI